MKNANLEMTARKLVASGKGILAADESTPTIEKRFKSVGIACTEGNRWRYREILFNTPRLSEWISGVILYDETFRQTASDGRRFVEVLNSHGIISGIKVDKGAKALAGFPGDRITEGLDGLRERLGEYRWMGAEFTKWRAVISVGPDTPSETCIRSNAEALARFAALSQEAELVPIVEPEVLMDGKHSIERHSEVTDVVLHAVFDALHQHNIDLEGMLLKPNMVLSGTDCPDQADFKTVAERTLACMLRNVPASVPGIVFLSGGQSERTATEHLSMLNRKAVQHTPPVPWQLSFSFGRALQAPALAAWKGQPANVEAAQQALQLRAECNSAARYGNYYGEPNRLAA